MKKAEDRKPWNWNQSQSLIRKSLYNRNQSKTTQGSVVLPNTNMTQSKINEVATFIPLIKQQMEQNQRLDSVDELSLDRQESSLPNINNKDSNKNIGSYSSTCKMD
jgi:hypothetical protein